MLTQRRVVVLLRLSLVALFALLVLLQGFSFPGQFAHMAEQSPEDAHLRWPLTALVVFWILCVQTVVVATWKLLGLVEDGRIFSDVSFVWVDWIVRAIGAAWVVLVAVFLFVGFHADDPGLPVLLSLIVVGVAVVGLLMLVMRALLRQASALQSDLEAVI